MQFGDTQGGIVEPYVIESPKVSGETSEGAEITDCDEDGEFQTGRPEYSDNSELERFCPDIEFKDYKEGPAVPKELSERPYSSKPGCCIYELENGHYLYNADITVITV